MSVLDNLRAAHGFSQHTPPRALDVNVSMKVITNHLLERTTLVHARCLPQKPWMRKRCYPRRVQKKWDKRYGVREELLFFVMGGTTLVCHPDNVKLLKAHFEEKPLQNQGQFFVGSALGPMRPYKPGLV